MSTDRETTRLVRSWLEEGATRLPDRVLDAVLDQVSTTPQRRSGWSAWRSYRMNTYAKLAAAAAAALVVAVVGYRLLPGNGGIGGSNPTTAPSPTASLLAKGTFVVAGSFNTTIDATGSGSNVSGTMTARDAGTAQGFSVDLQCERTIDGVLWIGGDVTETNYADSPKGTRIAILLKPGSPVQGIFAFQASDPPSASCQAFFDDMLALGASPQGLQPITGTVELAP